MTRRLLFALVCVTGLLFAQAASAGETSIAPAQPELTVMLTAVTGTVTGAAFNGSNTPKTYSADGATTGGIGTAVVSVEGSMNGGLSWDSPPICTITLSLATTLSSNGCTSLDRYRQLRGNVTTLSGTGAVVTLRMGY
jgi:hypothetical protein